MIPILLEELLELAGLGLPVPIPIQPSTWITGASYNLAEGQLTISTVSGRDYTYDVGPEIAVGLSLAPSPGTYFHDVLEG